MIAKLAQDLRHQHGVGLPGGMDMRQIADAARELRAGMKVLFIIRYAELNVSGLLTLSSSPLRLTPRSAP
jgi:hypothetical protein